MYLVNIRLLFRETEMFDTLVFDATQKVVAKEGVEDDVLEWCAVCVVGASLVDIGRIEEIWDEMDDDVVLDVARLGPFGVSFVE